VALTEDGGETDHHRNDQDDRGSVDQERPEGLGFRRGNAHEDAPAPSGFYQNTTGRVKVKQRAEGWHAFWSERIPRSLLRG